MFARTIALTSALFISVGLCQAVSAAKDNAREATVIVYRAAESLKTRRVNLNVAGNAETLGRLSAEEVLVTKMPAGEIALDTSIPGTEPLVLDLKPGATYYVHTQVKMRGSRVTAQLQEVAEQVAHVQQPALAGAI
jgi:hypothetical protein